MYTMSMYFCVANQNLGYSARTGQQDTCHCTYSLKIGAYFFILHLIRLSSPKLHKLIQWDGGLVCGVRMSCHTGLVCGVWVSSVGLGCGNRETR